MLFGFVVVVVIVVVLGVLDPGGKAFLLLFSIFRRIGQKKTEAPYEVTFLCTRIPI